MRGSGRLAAAVVAAAASVGLGADEPPSRDPRRPQLVAPADAPVGLEPVTDFAVPNGGGYGLGWSRDGKLLAVGGVHGDVVVLDGATFAVRASGRPESGPMTNVCIAPDGRRVAAVGPRGHLVVLDTATGALLGQAHGGDGCAWSPDGKWIAHGDPQAVLVRDAATLAPRKTFKTGDTEGSVSCVQVAPDGKRIVAGTSRGAIWVFDVATGKALVHTVIHDAESIVGVGFLAGGRPVAADQTGTVWSDSRTWELRAHLIAFSVAPDGVEVLAAGYAGGWTRGDDIEGFSLDTKSGARTAVAEIYGRHWIAALARSPDGKSLAWIGDGDTLGIVRDGRVRTEAATSGEIRALAFDGSGRFLAATGDAGTAFVDLPTGTVRRADGPAARAAAGRRPGEFAAALARWTLFDAVTGAVLPSGDAFATVPRWPAGPWTSPDGTTCIVADFDTVFRVEVGTGARRPLDLPREFVPPADVAWSPDGRSLAVVAPSGAPWIVGRLDGAEFRFDAPERARGAPPDARTRAGVAFSPSGRRLAVCDGKELLEVDPATRAELRMAPLAADWFRYLTEDLGIAATRDGLVQWDGSTGRTLPLLRGDVGARIALSPDGSLLAVATTERAWVVRVRRRP